jgi:putative inorganic carbon (hco3(-)) transporter
MNPSLNPSQGSLQKPITFLFRLLFFVTPLLLSPVSFEVFEFPKMLFVYLLTTLIVGAWIIRQIKEGRFIFQKTFLDLPLILFFLSQLISTIVSVDHHTSIFGYYSRLHGGLLSTISYILLYWTLVSNLSLPQRKSVIINSSLASGFFISIYAILEHFGIDKNIWIQDVQSRVFSTLGQPNWLAAYLSVLFPFVLLPLLFSPKKSSSLYLVLSVTYLLALLFTKSKSGFLAFVLSNLFLFLYLFKDKKIVWPSALRLFFIFSFVFLLIGTPYTPSLNQMFKKEPLSPSLVPETNEEMPLNITSSEDIRYIVWQGAINLWKKYPLFGTGTETFAYSYYWVRPPEHNLTSEWDFLYNKAHNEYLNFLATTGTFGLLANLFILFSIFIKSLKKPSSPAIFSSYLAIFITNFFGFSVVTIGLFFFTLPALINPKSKKQNFSDPGNHSLKKDFLILLFTLLSLRVCFGVISIYRADYHYNQSRKYRLMGQNKEALLHIDRALFLFPSEPNYYAEAATLHSQIAFLYFQTDPSSDQIEKHIQLALTNSQKTTDLSPVHPNLLKNRAQTLYTLTNIDPRYIENLLTTMQISTQLTPTDAKTFYNLALIYQLADQPQKAKETLLKTITLKANYDQAHFSLAQIYEQEGDLENAKKHYQQSLDINPQNQTAREKLEKL